jgi:exonuclease-1
MKALYTKNINFMVAPYESDSQLAKLHQIGAVDVVITEDSDLVVYGIPVVLKLNQEGDCDYLELGLWRPEDVESVFL